MRRARMSRLVPLLLRLQIQLQLRIRLAPRRNLQRLSRRTRRRFVRLRNAVLRWQPAKGKRGTRPDHEMYRFDYGSAICYLGAGDLLFTFNPHRLVPRNGPEVDFAKLRVIRAVLIDVHDQRGEKTVEGKAPDPQQY